MKTQRSIVLLSSLIDSGYAGEMGGKLLGIVTSRDFDLLRLSDDSKVSEIMTTELVVAKEGCVSMLCNCNATAGAQLLHCSHQL